MTEVQTRKAEMLARVRDFGARHVEIFPQGSQAAALFARINTLAQEITTQAAAQATAAGISREATANRALARENLRDGMEMIIRTARALSARVPNLDDKFRLPTSGRDQALLDAARAFADDVEPHKADFTALELGAEFFAKFEADIAAFERALEGQRTGREGRIKATAAVREAISEGASLVRQLDAIVRNKLDRDRVTLSAWRGARRVQGLSRGQKPAPAEQPAVPTATPAESPATR
jgi:hypothetical protein